MSKGKTKNRLRVLLNLMEVGVLQKERSGALQFSYSSKWLSHKKSFGISHSLPLQTAIFKGPEVYAFFDNLLPDSQKIRTEIAAGLGAASSEPFDLLSTIGRDCIGALQLLPLDQPLPSRYEIRKEPFYSGQIAYTLKHLAKAHLGLNREEDFRISLAGAQEKTALLNLKGKWFRPLGMTPTTHILKPPIGKLNNGINLTLSVENEWLCLKICEFLGLPVVETVMTKFKDMKSLVITRYDRRVDLKKKAIIRLPQEDLCQALGYNSSKKYENEGGPGIIEIMDFLDSSNERERDRHSFLKAQIIFQLLGAIDGHAKNFSVLLGPGGMVLAPIYDVMTVYLALQENQVQFKDLKLSMKVGDGKTYNLRYITRKHWFKTAARCHFPQQELEGIFKDLNEKLKKLPQRPFALPRGFPQSLYQATLRHIEKARRRLLGP